VKEFALGRMTDSATGQASVCVCVRVYVCVCVRERERERERSCLRGVVGGKALVTGGKLLARLFKRPAG
jgi:hypothetical protein